LSQNFQKFLQKAVGRSKFLSSGTASNNAVSNATSNAEHTVNIAADLRAAALTVQGVASQAKSKVQKLREQMSGLSPSSKSNVRKWTPEFNDQDVKTLQTNVIEQVQKDLELTADPQIRQELQRKVREIVVSAGAWSSITKPKIVRPNTATPEIESVTIDLDRNRGTTDCFFSKIVFQIQKDQLRNIRAIRIFRAAVENPIYTRPLSPLSSHGVQRLQALRGKKNSDNAAIAQTRLEINGVQNAISMLNPTNPFTNLRTSAEQNDTFSVPPAMSGKAIVNNFPDPIPDALAHLDRSVLENINVLANLRQHVVSTSRVNMLSSPVVVGDSNNKTASGLIIDTNNKQKFEQIAFIPISAARAIEVNGYIEYTFEDESVSYGKGYRYFIATVNSDLQQSPRSSIATVVVEGLRVPERPRNVVAGISQIGISLTIDVADQLVEKFEVYRKDSSVNAPREVKSRTLSDMKGFTSSLRTRTRVDNGYILIGEAINSLKGGAVYSDKNVRPGENYVYRVYSVDIFGNKSESPVETPAFIPDLEQKFVNLQGPTILAEVDATTGKVKITLQCSDTLVETLRLERRDLTIGQATFTSPDQPSRNIFGKGTVLRRRSFEGERLFNREPDISWNGIFSNKQEPIVFIDYTVTFDHTYQYRIHGVDRYGNRTSYNVTRPIMTIRRPFINTPVALTSSLIANENNEIGAVKLSWIEANIEHSAEEMIGSQATLTDTAKRTLYQVERKKKGEEIWQTFALTTASQLVDLVDTGKQAPNNRPSYVQANQVYEYRVQAIQSGAFISNFTPSHTVFAGFPIAPPKGLALRTPAVHVSPFYVMINWNTDLQSGVVDSWEIERAEVNNFAAARLNAQNPSDFKNLEFATFRTVYRESSRGAGKENDDIVTSAKRDESVIVGEHMFMDTMIDFGNSYFYRIRAVGPDGQKSPWVYRGIKITSAAFEKKWFKGFSSAERSKLSETYSSMEIRKPFGNKLSGHTFGMLAGFAQPPSRRLNPRKLIKWSK
jgi:hypothetical protein